MKIINHTVFILSFFVSVLNGQYSPNTIYLNHPEKVIPHADSCARFWLPTYDEEYGGFYENVNNDGSVSGTSKTMLGQTRTAYGMAKAFMLTGDTTYLEYARQTLNFMYEHAWDSENKGWFNEMYRDGSINANGDQNNRKWSFMQHYALLGIAAMVEVTQSELDWEFLLKGRNIVDEKLWDAREDYLGYYEEANVDWTNPRGKGFTPTMDAITTHVLSLYLLTGDEKYKTRLLQLADNVVDYLWPAMSEFTYGYPEVYNSNWNPDLNNTFVFTGHLLKSAWCITRAHLVSPKNSYVEFSNFILDEVLNQGYDEVYGGNYSNYNGKTGSPYGSDKEWWQLEQGFTSSIMNYYLTGNERFLQMADETIRFYFNYFVDSNNGEVYSSTSREGLKKDDRKAHYWKAGYHSIELAYFVYLYASLYLNQEPVNLYYKFDSKPTEVSYRLYPLAIENSKLIITSVLRDGIEYSNFDPVSRSLTVPANTQHIFTVTFDLDNSTYVNESVNVNGFKLYQNYPNPFNPSTVISYQLSDRSLVSLKIYDLLGREVSSLVSEIQSPGKYEVKFDASNLSSGIYIYRLNADSFSESKKMTVIQ